MTSREKFEQAIKARFGDSIDYRVCKNSDGDYMAWDMQVAWWAWQAAETELAVQLANAESKCRELAAELSAVDKIHNEAVFITDDHYEQCPPEVQKMIRSLAVLQIPAYDAYLAEVRAQGVERMIEVKRQQLDGMHPDTFAIGAVRDSIRRDIYELKVFAEILRQETAQ
ncbi:hypothetical protein ACV8SR_01245 [Citrobacter freundii]